MVAHQMILMGSTSSKVYSVKLLFDSLTPNQYGIING